MSAGTTTRLAPSPTGALHLGNLRTFLVNHLLAVRNGWRVLMRVEDLDGPRVKADAAAQVLEELAWLGLTWDGPIVHQSRRAHVYEAALEALVAKGLAYPCTCSRKDIAAAGGAPHIEDGLDVYPGTCRGRYTQLAIANCQLPIERQNVGVTPRSELRIQNSEQFSRPPAWRVIVPDAPVGFADRFAGEHVYDLARTCGDFVIFKNDGLAAYQLAVVIDDAESGVDVIVRGDDLLESAARQIHLRALLREIGAIPASSPEPEYWHLPLVVGPDGRRLAKRHGDTRLSHYRHLGTSPRRVLGLLGYWCGILAERREVELSELERQFDIVRLPRERIVFSAEDDAFLRG